MCLPLGLWSNHPSLCWKPPFPIFFPKFCWRSSERSRALSSTDPLQSWAHLCWHLHITAFSCCQLNLFFRNRFCEPHDYRARNHCCVEVIILKAFLQCVHSDQDIICILYPLTPCPKTETKHSVMSDCFELVLIWLEISHKATLVHRDYV